MPDERLVFGFCLFDGVMYTHMAYGGFKDLNRRTAAIL